jgi:hypothetical protein
MKRLLPLLLLLSACATPYAPPPVGQPVGPIYEPAPAAQTGGQWLSLALPADRERLLGADEAWLAGLREARRAGYGPQLAELGALADERAGLPGAAPPPGLYRCRTIKLGGGEPRLPYVAYDWFRCRIERTASGELRLDKLTGSQRQQGRLIADTDRRMAFLGAVAWGSDETSAPAYGAQQERDQVGFLERIGERRWCLALPFPRQESTLDLIEFVPVG